MRIKRQLALLVVMLLISFSKASVAYAAAWKAVSPAENITVECENKDNCSWQGVVMFENTIDRKLYDTVIWTRTFDFVGFDGNWTQRSQSARVYEPGARLSIHAKTEYPENRNTDHLVHTLGIDSKTCKFTTDQPDCYYYGGAGFEVVFNIVEPEAKTTPTLTPTPTPTPTTAHIPTDSVSNQPSPTAPIASPTKTVQSTPTNEPKPTSAPTDEPTQPDVANTEAPSSGGPSEENKTVDNNESLGQDKTSDDSVSQSNTPEDKSQEESSEQGVNGSSGESNEGPRQLQPTKQTSTTEEVLSTKENANDQRDSGITLAQKNNEDITMKNISNQKTTPTLWERIRDIFSSLLARFR